MMSIVIPMIESYQERVGRWLYECFGQEIAKDSNERLHRFLEEAIELAQAAGCTRADAQQLLEYVYARPDGDPTKEVGGVMVTLAGFCQATGIDLDAAAESELSRNQSRTQQIRAKRAAKLAGSPLP